MSLLLGFKNIYTGKLEVDGAVKVRLVLNKNSLSIPYELEEGTEVIGKIVGVYQKEDNLSRKIDVPQMIVKFILMDATSSSDSLYMEKDSWYRLRDYGILPDSSRIDILIEKVIVSGVEVEVFPKRIVKI